MTKHIHKFDGKRQAASGGFTLTELLVVMAIILILITMFMPMFSRYRIKATEVACASDLRQLLVATLQYAEEHDGWLPDLSKNGPDEDSYQQSQFTYWTWAYWRDLFNESYGLTRAQWYSASNWKWNRDDFYHWAGKDERMVMGRYYFACERYNRIGFMDNIVNRPPDLRIPMFPSRLGFNPYYKILWSDLNRQWPAGPGDNWVTPGDPRRWGSNHLYPGNTWPTGNHIANEDGSIFWVEGSNIQYRITFSGAEIYW